MKMKMHFLKTKFGALSIILFMPLKTKLHLLRTLKDTMNSTLCANWAYFTKVRLQLRKLGTVEHTNIVNYILPHLPKKQAEIY